MVPQHQRAYVVGPKGSPGDEPLTYVVFEGVVRPANETVPSPALRTWIRGSRRERSSSERLPCGVSCSSRPSTEVPRPLLSALRTSAVAVPTTATDCSVVMSALSAASTVLIWFSDRERLL